MIFFITLLTLNANWQSCSLEHCKYSFVLKLPKMTPLLAKVAIFGIMTSGLFHDTSDQPRSSTEMKICQMTNTQD